MHTHTHTQGKSALCYEIRTIKDYCYTIIQWMDCSIIIQLLLTYKHSDWLRFIQHRAGSQSNVVLQLVLWDVNQWSWSWVCEPIARLERWIAHKVNPIHKCQTSLWLVICNPSNQPMRMIHPTNEKCPYTVLGTNLTNESVAHSRKGRITVVYKWTVEFIIQWNCQ